jgi:hypothetical protein
MGESVRHSIWRSLKVRRKITVLGGGMASLAAVYELTSLPGWRVLAPLAQATARFPARIDAGQVIWERR